MRSFAILFVIIGFVVVGCGASQKTEVRPEAPRAYRDPSSKLVATRHGRSDCETCTCDGPDKLEYACPSDGPVADVEVDDDDIVERVGNVLVVTAATGQYCCTIAPDCVTGTRAWDVNPFCIGRMNCRPVLYVGDRK